METKKVQVYQFEELTGNALENAKKLLKNLQDNYSEDYFCTFAREDMETTLIDCFGLNCGNLKFGLYPTYADATNVALSEKAVAEVFKRIYNDENKKAMLPEGLGPSEVEIKKIRYGCDIYEYGDFAEHELDDKAYSVIENTALEYIKESLKKAVHDLELNDEYYYSDEFRDELIARNDIVFDKHGNILDNDILEG